VGNVHHRPTQLLISVYLFVCLLPRELSLTHAFRSEKLGSSPHMWMAAVSVVFPVNLLIFLVEIRVYF